MRAFRALAALSATVGACLTLAVPATAAITTTSVQVTSPSGTYILDDEVGHSETITLTGTSVGATAGEKLDIRCYYGNTWSTLSENVEVKAGGGFSFSGSLNSIADFTCVLRAVPHGDATDYPPGSTSPYTGPTLAIDLRRNTVIESGANKGALSNYAFDGDQLLGAVEFGSLGACGVESYVNQPVTFAYTQVADCEGFLGWENGRTEAGFATPTRSELQVDGANAFLAGNASSLPGGAEHTGFPMLGYTFSIDPATGDLVLEESDEVVRCEGVEPSKFPPTAESCKSFVPAGVEAHVRYTQSHGGLVATATQRFESTDGRSHQLDLLEEHDFLDTNGHAELSFPWLASPSFSSYTTAGETLSGPGGAPGSFYVKETSGEGAYGAATFARAPAGEVIVGAKPIEHNGLVWTELHYPVTVPASGSLALGFTYSDAFLLSEVEHFAAAAQAAYVPAVTITSPASGATSTAASTTVSGTASDANGIASVTVDGQAATVAPNGTWTATVPLTLGANTLTATVTNIFGNTASAHTAVTYTPPSPAPPTLTVEGAPHATAQGVKLTLVCTAPTGQTCDGTAVLTTRERRKGTRVLGVSARRHAHRSRKRTRHVPITVGRTRLKLAAGQTETVLVRLNRTGHRLLARFHRLPVALVVTLSNGAAGKPTVVVKRKLTIRSPKHKRRHGGHRGGHHHKV